MEVVMDKLVLLGFLALIVAGLVLMTPIAALASTMVNQVAMAFGG
jgi:hypothetical protein